MDFDEDMSGLQIEDLGEYFLQTDINDNWKGFSLGYTDEEQQQQQNSKQAAGAQASESSAGASSASAGSGSMQHLTSPPLSSISEMLKHGNGLGVGLGFGSPRKDFTTLFQTGLTPHAKPDAAMMNRATRDAMELASFSLDQHKKPAALAMPGSAAAAKAAPLQLGGSIKPAAPKLPSPQCQNILSSDDDDMNSFGGPTFKREFDFMTVSCDPSGCSTIGSGSSISAPSPTPEDDRGFRKKSREKMRRQEVNVKFEELVDLLGLSNRVRKSAILQEAVSAIKTLKRERDELRRDRDRLQQEVSKLATCLQYSHLGSVAAANAAAMTQQPNQQISHMNPSAQHLNQHHHHQDRQVPVSSGMQAVHTHPLNVPCNPGTNCFPLSSAFSNISSQLGTHSSSSSSASGQVVIAPKSLKPATSSFTPIAPDTEMK